MILPCSLAILLLSLSLPLAAQEEDDDEPTAQDEQTVYDDCQNLDTESKQIYSTDIRRIFAELTEIAPSTNLNLQGKDFRIDYKPDLTWTDAAVDFSKSDTVQVYFGPLIYETAANDTDIAYILAHEIGHIAKKHPAKTKALISKRCKEMLQESAECVADADEFCKKRRDAIINELAPVIREHENQADSYAKELMARAGYEDVDAWINYCLTASAVSKNRKISYEDAFFKRQNAFHDSPSKRAVRLKRPGYCAGD
ncbi:MAG: M48 family metalloprotease [Elusimicrobiota bacterium]